MSKVYIALIADAVRSRALPPARRARLQAELRRALSELNRTYRHDLAAAFGITQGDELQCLLVSTKRVWDIAHAIRYRFAEADWVVGCGRGTVTTSLAAGKLSAPEVDGPCFHEARAAVEAAKRDRMLFAFRGFGDAEPTLNELLPRFVLELDPTPAGRRDVLAIRQATRKSGRTSQRGAERDFPSSTPHGLAPGRAGG